MATYPAPSRSGLNVFNIITYQNSDNESLSISPGPLVVNGNILCSGGVSGTLTKAAQPNVTSLGTLSSLNVTGNVTIDSNTLTVDSVNNRVGIVSGTPAYPLDITGNVNTTGTYKIGGADVFSSATTLASGVTASSLTSVGTLSGGCNIATGQAYKVNGSSVLTAFTLGSGVTSSSLTSIGTLSGGCNIATGQAYKVNGTSVLTATSLGASVVNSALTSVGTLDALTVTQGGLFYTPGGAVSNASPINLASVIHDYFLETTRTSATTVSTFPQANASNRGMRITIFNNNTAGNAVTVNAFSGQSILAISGGSVGSGSTFGLGSGRVAMFMSDGSNWVQVTYL